MINTLAVVTITPAYGRGYTTLSSVLSAHADNKDFRCALTGRYVNKEDAEKYLKGSIIFFRQHIPSYILVKLTEISED